VIHLYWHRVKGLFDRSAQGDAHVHFAHDVRSVRRQCLRDESWLWSVVYRCVSRRTKKMPTSLGESTRTGLSAAALKKVAILSAIAQYQDAAYGLKRLQKVIYRASKEASVNPFSYCVWRFGQHSREMTALLNEMVQDGLVLAEDLLPRKRGKLYRLTHAGHSVMECLAPVDRVLPGYDAGLRVAMQEVGRLRDPEIDRWAKESPEVKGRAQGTILLQEDLSTSTAIPGLTDTQIEDLELALNTGFISATRRVLDVMKKSDLDLAAIHEWNGEPSVPTPSP